MGSTFSGSATGQGKSKLEKPHRAGCEAPASEEEDADWKLPTGMVSRPGLLKPPKAEAVKDHFGRYGICTIVAFEFADFSSSAQAVD
jgi:hypothetical protein